ncbi:MAG: DHHA1 domain-containing protein [Alphaproteobacteria bacterium]|nr:DHHA1 domain-containing protein [Alphaproteobacteria bacterium]
MLCIYHIADHDGKGSAAIVKSVYPETELMGLNHDMEIPYGEINKHDKIIVCDFSLPLDFMFQLSQTRDFTWIDHHVSVIDKYEKIIAEGNRKPIKGIRRVGTAALMLTWEYFYPDRPLPLGIKLLGLNDVFDLRDKRVRPFEYAMQALGVNRPTDKIWSELINDTLDVSEMVEKGKAILLYIRNRNYRLVRSEAFESEYQGLKCICANIPQGYSEFYDSLDNVKDYDMMVNFFMNKKNCWNLSFYTAKDNVDVSKVAAQFGGGGHAKAAGASSLPELPEFLRKGNMWVSPKLTGNK